MLERVEVLCFVDQQVSESPTEGVTECVVTHDFLDDMAEHVVEVDDAAPSLELLVARVDGSALFDARRRVALLSPGGATKTTC